MSSDALTNDSSKLAADAAAIGRDLRAIQPFLMKPLTRFRFAVAVIYCLPVMTFTMPGRPSPSKLAFLDPLAIFKVGILAAAIFGAAGLIWMNRRSREVRFAIGVLGFYFVYLAWAIASVMWSPLRGVSLGQAGGLCSMLLFSVVIASLCRDKLYVSRILKHLCFSLTAFSAFVLSVYAYSPVASGLDRSIMLEGGDGLVHPTAAGAAASLGLLVSTLSFVVMRFPWASRAFWISIAINGPLLYLSNSRASILMAVATIPFAMYMFGSVRGRGIAALAFAVFSMVYLMVDPGFTLLEDSIGAGTQYLSRGQSAAQLRSVSGRAEMWTAVWEEYQYAKIMGHGYFITSRTGQLDVWETVFNHTAHNVYLQVLASTGLIGLLLFLIALQSVLRRVSALRKGDQFSRHLLWMLAIASLWYLGWSMGCVSFMGPIRSESIVFFTLLGVGVGDLCRSRMPSSGIVAG